MSSKLARTLPDDLLYHIFSHALPSTYIECSFASKARKGGSFEGHDIYEVAPMKFSLVCRSWRNVVMSQARLWNSIEINFKLPNDSKSLLPVPPALRLLRIWFRNSRNTPLNIRFMGQIPPDQISTYNCVLDVLLEEQHRWNIISFNLRYRGSSFMHENVTIASKSLTSISLSFTGRPPRRPITIDFSLCRELRALEVHDGVELSIRGPQPLLLESLESLSLQTFANSDLPGLRRLLRASLNLRSLEIIIIDKDFSVVDMLATETTLLLPSLTQLTIASATTFLTLEVLAWINCPNLTYFKFSALRYISDVQVTKDLLLGFEQFLSRSRPRLLSLSLQDYRHWNWHWKFFVEDDDDEPTLALSQECAEIARRILSTLSSLISLSIAGNMVDEQLVEAMVLRKDDCGRINCDVCPQLESISFFCEDFRVSPETLVNMITSRWELGSSFKRVDLCLPVDYERVGEKQKDVARCIEGGLDCKITYTISSE